MSALRWLSSPWVPWSGLTLAVLLFLLRREWHFISVKFNHRLDLGGRDVDQFAVVLREQNLQRGEFVTVVTLHYFGPRPTTISGVYFRLGDPTVHGRHYVQEPRVLNNFSMERWLISQDHHEPRHVTAILLSRPHRNPLVKHVNLWRRLYLWWHWGRHRNQA